MALIKRYNLKTGLSSDNIKRVVDEPNIDDMRPEDTPEYT